MKEEELGKKMEFVLRKNRTVNGEGKSRGWCGKDVARLIARQQGTEDGTRR